LNRSLVAAALEESQSDLKKLGNSPKVPMSHHAKANELQQEAFKKLPMRVMRLKEAYPTAKVVL
jgi:transposase